MKNNEPVIRFEHISMQFPGVLANDDVSLEIRRGEVFALIGENGAGKSTLMNILYGIQTPSSGAVYIKGRLVESYDPKNVIAQGVGMVHQHFMLVPSFTVAQNIVMSREPRKHKIFFDNAAAEEAVRKLEAEYGLTVPESVPVEDISVGLQQRVEILKALYRGAEILILDEPTAVLTPQETERLFTVLRNMRQDGKAIVIITHKLNEVMAISDKVAVLRKGKYIGTVETAQTDPQALTDMMVGRSVKLNIDRPLNPDQAPRLQVKDLCCYDHEHVKKLDRVSFTAMGGEILGVAGIAGSGQKELLEAIAGLYPVAEGSIRYTPPEGEAQELVGQSPMQIRRRGVSLAFIPEDRLGMGLVGSMGMTGNMLLRSWKRGRLPFIRRKEPQALAKKVYDDLEVVTPSLEFPVRKLSGGNVQKVLVGREIASSPNVLMTAYAVRGLDINTSYTIYNLMTQQKMKGVAVIFVGEDLDVLLELCDRILVLCGGRVSGIVDARTATKEEIGLLMTRVGGKEEA